METKTSFDKAGQGLNVPITVYLSKISSEIDPYFIIENNNNEALDIRNLNKLIPTEK